MNLGYPLITPLVINPDQSSPIPGTSFINAPDFCVGTTGVKDDSGKDRWELLPWNACTALVKVLTFGAKKYADNGWRTVLNAKDRYTAAMLRHQACIQRGELLDYYPGSCATCDSKTCLKHTGMPHSWCVLTNAAFLVEFDESKEAK